MSGLRTTHIPKEIADQLFPREEYQVPDPKEKPRQTVTITTAHGDPVTVDQSDMQSDPEVRRQVGEIVKNAVVAGARRRGGEAFDPDAQLAADILTESLLDSADGPGEEQSRFKLPPPPIGEYMHAPDLRKLYDRLFDEYEGHPLVNQLAWHVEDAEIKFAWKQKGGKSQGRATLGKCVKLSGAAKFYANDADFLIWFAWDNLAGLRVTDHQALALMFHELSHIEKLVDDETGEISYAIKGHDIEAFNAEIELWGPWKSDLKATAETFRQLGFDVGAE